MLTPCQANVEQPEQFVAPYKELKENLTPEDQIYFMDGVHPPHNTIASYGWIQQGQTKHLQTTNGRKRTNLNGALNLAAKELFYMEDERLNSQTIIAFLNQRLEKQESGKISMILDHARYYHSQIVTDSLTEHPPIVLKFIPPD